MADAEDRCDATMVEAEEGEGEGIVVIVVGAEGESLEPADGFVSAAALPASRGSSALSIVAAPAELRWLDGFPRARGWARGGSGGGLGRRRGRVDEDSVKIAPGVAPALMVRVRARFTIDRRHREDDGSSSDTWMGGFTADSVFRRRRGVKRWSVERREEEGKGGGGGEAAWPAAVASGDICTTWSGIHSHGRCSINPIYRRPERSEATDDGEINIKRKGQRTKKKRKEKSSAKRRE